VVQNHLFYLVVKLRIVVLVLVLSSFHVLCIPVQGCVTIKKNMQLSVLWIPRSLHIVPVVKHLLIVLVALILSSRVHVYVVNLEPVLILVLLSVMQVHGKLMIECNLVHPVLLSSPSLVGVDLFVVRCLVIR
jgi:hypothetical protein